ncbi:MAG: ABC transporter ATP-binding protein [bacterium]
MSMPLIELQNVTKRYGQDEPVLQGISLAIQAGETLAVVGPSGSGKSTLLNLLGALDAPTTGRVLFEQEDLAQYGDDRLAGFRNQAVGFVFQRHHLLPQLTALENVLVPTLVPASKRRDAAAERAGRLLERVGLGGRVHSRPGELSGGERQRVAVVRALINAPKLILADEPTGSLDATTAGSLVDLLVELNREEGVALVMVTHAAILARRMDKVLELHAGSLGKG